MFDAMTRFYRKNIELIISHTHTCLFSAQKEIIRKTSWWARQDAKLVTSHVFGGCFKTAAQSLGILFLIIFLLIWPILVTRVNVTLEVSCIPKFMSVSWFLDLWINFIANCYVISINGKICNIENRSTAELSVRKINENT